MSVVEAGIPVSAAQADACPLCASHERAPAVAPADKRDAAVPDSDVGLERFTTAAVADPGVANQDIQHWASLSHNERSVQYRGGT